MEYAPVQPRGSSPPPSDARMREIHRLWDRLSDTHVSQLDEASRHLMTTICEWIGADNAFWVGGLRVTGGATARRDPQRGWRARSVQNLNMSEETKRLIAHAMREQDTKEPPMTTCAVVREAGRFRTYRLRNLVDLAAFRRTAHYATHFAPFKIVDRIWAAFPVNEHVESYYCFDRFRPRRPFTARDEALVGFTLRAIKYFHRELLFSHGLHIAHEPLLPSERRILTALMTERSEKEIAADLGIAYATVHSSVTNILRKFGVNSRVALMTLWLQ